MANMGSQGILKHIDDSATAILSTSEGAGKTWITTGTGTTFIRAVAAGKGLHYAGVTGGTTTNLIEWCSPLKHFAGQEGHSAMEIMIQFSAVTSLAFNFGFNDDVLDASGLCPVTISTAAWTANAGTFLGFVYDTGATNNELHCYWANGGTVGMTDADSSVDGQVVRMKGMAPTLAKWLYLKVEMQDRGSGKGVRATFLAVDHLGRSMEKVFNTSVDRTTALDYHYAIESRGSAVTIYMKGCNWEQTIPNM